LYSAAITLSDESEKTTLQRLSAFKTETEQCGCVDTSLTVGDSDVACQA
jgi:hypothetical protein